MTPGVAHWAGGALLLLAACGSPGPVGVYELDVDALVVGAPEAEDPAAVARNTRTAADLRPHVSGRIELRADGTASGRFEWLVLAPQEWDGRWELAGERLTITPEGGEAQEWQYAPGTLRRSVTLSLLDLTLTYRRR